MRASVLSTGPKAYPIMGTTQDIRWMHIPCNAAFETHRDQNPVPHTSTDGHSLLLAHGFLHQQDLQDLTSQGTDLILKAMAVDYHYCQPRRRLDNLTPPLQPLLAPATGGCPTSAPSNAMYIYLSQRSSPVMYSLNQKSSTAQPSHRNPLDPNTATLPSHRRPSSNHTHHPHLFTDARVSPNAS